MLPVPYHADIPEPVLVDPPAEDLTSQGVYIPPSLKPHVKVKDDSDLSHSRQLKLFHDAFRVKRWTLPSWGWIGIRTHYGHSDAEWEAFRRKVVSAYRVVDSDEAEKFRIVWIEDKDKLDGADDKQTREVFQNWFLHHSDPPDGHYSVIPTIKKVWSGYETMVCLVADKEAIDSVLADESDTVDKSASLKILARWFDERDMRKWAPKLVGRYHGTFRVSPHFLSSLDGRLDEDSSYGQMGGPSTWYLKSQKMADGVLREQNNVVTDDEYRTDPINLKDSSSDEESDESEDRTEL